MPPSANVLIVLYISKFVLYFLLYPAIFWVCFMFFSVKGVYGCLNLVLFLFLLLFYCFLWFSVGVEESGCVYSISLLGLGRDRMESILALIKRLYCIHRRIPMGDGEGCLLGCSSPRVANRGLAIEALFYD